MHAAQKTGRSRAEDRHIMESCFGQFWCWPALLLQLARCDSQWPCRISRFIMHRLSTQHQPLKEIARHLNFFEAWVNSISSRNAPEMHPKISFPSSRPLEGPSFSPPISCNAPISCTLLLGCTQSKWKKLSPLHPSSASGPLELQDVAIACPHE